MAKKTKAGRGKTNRSSVKNPGRRVVKKTAAKKTAAAARKTRPAGKTAKRAKHVRATGSRAGKKPAASARKKSFGARDKQAFKKLLLGLRDHITGQIDFLATDNLNRTQEDSELDFRSEEQGTDNHQRDMALSRLSLEQNAIFEINEALHRIERGTFGKCQGCEKPIEKARLSAIPYSRLCVSCQTAEEAGGAKSRSFNVSMLRDVDAAKTDANVNDQE